ncbi:MAG: transporter substrate-binding domain-containing protein [Gammaproteobacteria bacterium]|nr:transporter substrate-binding domain-containing protein [Gammaproteobacteria bacterium]
MSAAPAEVLPGRAQEFTLRVGYQPYYAEAWSGVLVRGLGLYERSLPAGDRVAFSVGIKGAGVLVSALRRGEVDLAYLGLEPTLTVTQDLEQGDFRIIAVSAVSKRLCNVIVARPGAPPMNSRAALRWLAGKRIAVPRGSCAELFLGDVLARADVQPARIFDQSIDMLAASLESRAVDAVAVWEPNATELVHAAGAQRLIDGDSINESGAAFLVARASLLKYHPDVVADWLAAERAAQLLLARGGAEAPLVERIESQETDLPRSVVHTAWWGEPGSPPPATFPFIGTPEISRMLREAAGRMAARGLLQTPALRPGTVDDELARAILAREEAGR